MPDANNTGERLHEHAWRYFEIHANHRLTLFNYFLILSGLLAAGLAASIQQTGHLSLLGGVLGVLMALVSFVFWKLDQRASFFVKRSEEALAKLELGAPLPAFHLFSDEPNATRKAQETASTLNPHWTYGKSFRVVFGVMAIAGILGALLSVSRFVVWFVA